MKKALTCILFLALLSVSGICHAGSVPVDLLGSDDAQVYFGELIQIKGNMITVKQHKNIKGKFEEGTQYTYSDYAFTDSPDVGEIYLCGYFDENNPLYIWEVTSLDTKTLKIKSDYDMSQRMQKYLNSGAFEQKEAEKAAAQTAAANAPQDDDCKQKQTSNKAYIISALSAAAVAVAVFAALRRKRKKSA